ncbi:hypothetical protein [Halomonas sp. PBN3]|uniref:hypothetical protein n=1 Tax=Halomonas sp. PBN3 TaxID=1397528 RepID=UPI0003B8A66F|nr:hypothetical protein [Halomonas sp. PBN3]ERS88845.1 hypothetical protein Q671_08010 [Halomonas sp. PBN3]
MAKDLNLSVTLKAINKATGPLKKILQGSRAVGRAMRETRDELRGFNDQQKRISAFRDMSRQSLETRNALREKRAELDRVSQELKNATGPTRRLTQQQERAQREVDKLNTEYREQRDRVRELSRGLPRAEDGTRGLAQQQERLARQAREATERLNRQRDAMRRLTDANVSGRFNNMAGEIGRLGRRTLFAAGAAAGGIFGIANSTATLGDDVAKTSAKIGISTQELQELRYAAERSGVSTQKLDSSTERFVKRLGEARQGGGAAAKAYEQLGLDANKLAELTPAQSLRVVADELAKVENHSDRVALAAQFFGREGVAMINMLKDGSAGLDQYARDARRVGFALGDDAAAGSEAFKDAMLDAGLSLQGMKNTIGAELMPAITDLMKEFSGWMRENREQVKAFARTFGERLKAAVPTILQLGRGVATFAATLGDLTTKAAAAVGGFDNLAFVVGGLFAGKAILSVVSFAVGVGKAIGALSSFASTLPIVTGAVKALGIAFAATPLGWVVAGITAIAMSAALVIKYWKPIKAFFAGLGQGIRDGLSPLLTSLAPALATIKAVLSPLKPIWDGIASAMGTVWGWVTKLLAPVESTSESLEAATNAGRLFGEALAGIINFIPNAIADFSALGVSLIDGLIGGIDAKWQALREKISGMASGITGWFKEKLGIASPSRVFAGFGANLLDGLINGIDEKWQLLKDKIGATAGAVTNWFKDKLGINSPSKVFAEFGVNTMQGYQAGIERGEDQPLREMGAFTRRLQQAGLALGAAAAASGAPAGQGAPLGMPAFDARPPLTAPSGGSSSVTIGDIHVHAAPGMDEQALAQRVAAEVQRALAAAERDAAARRRSAFHDID